jgi:hypothetical protein
VASARNFLTQSTQYTNKYNAASNLLCMNARIERMVNAMNLSVRITVNRALDQKIWAMKAFRGKTVFSGVFWGFLEFWSGWRGLAQNTGASAKFGNFLGIFGEFSGCLE